ncbi:aldehyde dehydrogenase [Metabacillus arenae]|uniref:Aldehyde dehydrogenase n=1 Tax=Metabacillus arenae TaxID=2771434 RepID=A0A926NA11_9BACI|nr:aldehyde dehydrogenase [Metabacillus arenae]MBD1380317.1 aldehyde dehydrogenase [Metabacillus arenae]
MQPFNLYINGHYTESESSETIDVLNPSTGDVISKIANGTEEDANKAIEAADRAQKEWEKVSPVERGKIVRQIGDRLEQKKDTFIKLLQEEQGKPYDQAEAEVDTAIDYFRYMADWARRMDGEIVQSDRPNENIFIYRRPIGVVAGIVPWNFPVFILARKVATALVTGCTIVLKPSQQTPNTANEFTKIIHELNLPKGVYNFITGKGSTIGNAMASHPKVGMVTMTGSIKAGQKVMEAAAKNITKVNLELGGKAPAIVTENADLDLAIENIKQSRLTNAGQACTNAERVYVHRMIADSFIKKLTDAMKEVTIGNPLDSRDIDMGPLISEDRLKTVDEMVQNARKDGAEVLTGGSQVDRKNGYYYEPTILTNVTQDMEIIQEEIFGPVLPVIIYDNLEEAITMANDTKYGLSSSVYTENLHEAMHVVNSLKFGETFINRENFEAIQGYHAGMRQSGLGGADGKHGMEDYLHTHVAYFQYKNEL